MEFKGTKGQWYPIEYAGRIVIQSVDYYSDCDDILNCDDFIRYEVEANAKLISKAPEMLEMLKGVLSDIDSGNYPNGEWKYDEIHELIKEATEL